MATSEQLLTALCTALRGATLPNSTTWLHPSPSLREIADGRDDILAEARP
jgi:hypothetical protein